MTPTIQPPDPAPNTLSAARVLGALSFALDLTDGQPMGHSMQSCVLGMRLSRALHLEPTLQYDLYYALLLKDAGCSSNASKLFHLLQSDEIKAKRHLKSLDTGNPIDQLKYAFTSIAAGKPLVERLRHIAHLATAAPVTGDLIQIRCDRGASIARRIGFSLQVAEAIASLDERWDGNGYPMHLSGRQIPLMSRIMNIAQNLAVFYNLGGPAAAIDVLKRRSGKWFDPDLVCAALALAASPDLFDGLDDATLSDTVAAFEPHGYQLNLDNESLDRICDAFAEVIDTKSPYTYRHSAGVAKAAVAIALNLGLSPDQVVLLRRASLLHDIGKLAIPNSILEKPGKLTADEWTLVRQHPNYTLQVLSRVPGFEQLSQIAASHHERLDGSGYFRDLSAPDLDIPARILAVADVYDALAAKRPYRDALPREKVFSILFSESPHGLDHDCITALHSAPEHHLELPETFQYQPTQHSQPAATFHPFLEPHYA